MERAEDRWHHLLDSQSRTLEAAVAEYRKRYTISPPAGFEKWWQFCEENGVVMRDEYDQLMRDVLPHHALEPATFIQRSKALQDTGFTYNMAVDGQGVRMSGPRAGQARPKMMENLVAGFVQYLPRNFDVKVVVSDHDTGSDVLGQDQRDRAMELVKEGGRE